MSTPSIENRSNEAARSDGNAPASNPQSAPAKTSGFTSRAAHRAELMGTPCMSPLGLMRSFMEDMDRMMDALPLGRSAMFAGPLTRLGLITWKPPLTMMERDGALVVRADMPGLKPDDVRVELEDGHLTISGERTEERSRQESGFYRNERSYGAFRRVIGLPEGVGAEHVSASFDSGVLEIRIATPQRKKAQRIEVKAMQQANEVPAQPSLDIPAPSVATS